MTLFSSGITYSNPLMSLAMAALRTTLLAGGIALVLRIPKLRATSMHLFAWTTVIYLGLCMPFLGWLLPPIPITVPSLRTRGAMFQIPTSTSAQSSSTEDATATGQEATTHNERSTLSPVSATRDIRFTPFRLPEWSVLAMFLYLAVAALLIARLLLGTLSARRLVRSARSIQDARTHFYLADFQLSHSTFRVCESKAVAVPVTVGVFSQSILLPVGWRDWDEAKLHAVMTHEISHVIRRDTLSQYAALLHRAVFWFSPLAWWLSKHIATLSEEASDEAALAAGIERSCYARTLLGFLQAASNASGRVQWLGVSMATRGPAEKRLNNVLAWRGANKMRINRLVIAVIYAVAVPAVYLTAAARTVPQVAPTVPVSMARDLSSPEVAGDVEPQSPVLAVSQAVSRKRSSHAPMGPSAASPVAPAAPASLVAYAAQSEEGAAQNHRQGFAYGYGFDDEQRFVIVSGKSEGFTMSGSGDDAHHVQKLKARIPGDFIWFQRDEKSYVIRDQATVDRALQLWAPQERLGKQQAELGKQQEALGKQQAELGERMRATRVNVPDLTAQIDKLKAEMKALGPNASMEQIGEFQEHIGELQAQVGEVQAHAGDEQGKLGTEMGKLGEQQGKLGEQQGDLGRQQGELAEKATKQMKELLDEAIKKGTAQPEPAEGGGASL